MANQIYVRAVDMQTDEETVEGPFPVRSAAVAYAESWAENFYGGEDEAWFKEEPLGTFLVGRIAKDGFRSNPLTTITIDEDGVSIQEDPTFENGLR